MPAEADGAEAAPLGGDPPRDTVAARSRPPAAAIARRIVTAKGNPGMATELPEDATAAGGDGAAVGPQSEVATTTASAAPVPAAPVPPIADPQGHVPMPVGHFEPVTLAERVDALKAELDALGGQIARKRPWWREVTTLVAVTALVFSFGTTIVSYVRTSEQDVHDSAVELRTLVERLTQIPADVVQANKTYADDPVTASTLASIYTQEEVLDAQQAAQIMDRIPDQVTPPEYSLVANILIGAGIDHPSLEMLDLAAKGANNVNDFVSAVRTKAIRVYQLGDPTTGRALFQSALDVFTKSFASSPAAFRDYTDMQTQVDWAESELGIHDCALATQHFGLAKAFTAEFDPSDSKVKSVLALEPYVTACAAPAPSGSPAAP